MTARTWNTLTYQDLAVAGNWSGAPSTLDGDTLIMRHGVGYLSNTNLGLTNTLYLGTYVSPPAAIQPTLAVEPATLVLDSAIARLNFGAYGELDGNAVFGGRGAAIDVNGNSGAIMTSNGPGTSSAAVWIGNDSTFVGVQNFGATPTIMRISGSSSGAYINLSSSLYDVTEVVETYTTGTGTWDLWGNDQMSFIGGVASGQTVNLHLNSFLQLNNPQTFQGTINIGDDFSSYVFLVMNEPVTSAEYAKDMTTGANTLTFTGADGRHAQIALNDDSPKGFEVVGTAWGASIVPNTVQDAPAGDTLLLRHGGAPA